MRLLLDTHIAIWSVTTPERLADIPAILEDPTHEVVVSAVTVWEIAIKFALRRGRPDDMPISGERALRYFADAGYEFLAVTAEHAAAVDDLPALHRDPFDRLLIAQALHEPLRLITHDRKVAAYSPGFLLV